MRRMLRAALELAAAGWAVLPLDGKRPITTHGHKDATTDPTTIEQWWHENDWNIGSPVPDSLVVFDVDPRNGGSIHTLEQLAGVTLPPTLEVISGRGDGGRHLYFRRPFERPYRGNIPHGIDVKINGYMVMPPSSHPETDKPYRWSEHDIARLPSQVVELLRPGVQTARDGTPATDAAALAAWLRDLRPGERHDGLFWAANRAHEAGMSRRSLELLVDAAEDIGINRHEAERVVESARGNHA